MNGYRPGLCLDFDGVLHHMPKFKGYTVIEGEVVAGAAQFLRDAVAIFTVSIFSCRSRSWFGRQAMRRWTLDLLQATYGIEEGRGTYEELKFPRHKPPATVFLDDRALRFEGVWPDLADLMQFKPWNWRRLHVDQKC